MLKCLIVAICAGTLITTVFCAPGYEKPREKQTSLQDGFDHLKTNGASRRRRQSWETVDIEFIDASLIDPKNIKDLRSKESSSLSPVYDMMNPGEEFQQRTDANTELINKDSNYIYYKVKSTAAPSPIGLQDDRTTRDSYYDSQNYSYDKEQYLGYSDERHSPLQPPPDDGRPHPLPGYHPPPPPPPPPPPYHPPPPPHHYPPPPPHHYPPPPPHHYPPPPPHHHSPPPPPPPYEYRSNYNDHSYSQYNDYNYSRPPPPQPPPSRYEERSKIDDDRQTRQSSYYDRPHRDGIPPPDQHGWPPPAPPHHGRPPPPSPPHHGGGPPPPHHHGGPPPPPSYGGPPPHHGGPPDPYDVRPTPQPFNDNQLSYPRRRPAPPPDSERPQFDGRQPYNNQQFHDRGNEYNQYSQYDDNQSFSNQDQSKNPRQQLDRKNNGNSAKIIAATQNVDPNIAYQFISKTSTTTEAGSDDDQYLLDVRFADDSPTENTMKAVRPKVVVNTSRRLSPFAFQAAAVIPEDK